MKAFQVVEIGHPAGLVEIDKPTPGSGEVLLEIYASGLNFADLLMESGTYQAMPAVPFTLGLELSGVVVEIAANVTTVDVGDRVAVFAASGGLAEFGCFPATRCLRLPASMSFQDAAAFQIAYGTSHLALHHRANICADDTVLVLGSAGGVGLTAIQIAKLSGATVIAVARGARKLAIAKAAGADHLIDSETADIRTEVTALGGADIVYDPVGGDQFKAALRACNPQARVIVIGFASGTVPQIPANIILVKNITIIGHYWGGYLDFAPATLADSLRDLLRWY
ncbi:MAG: NADPH:quinone oxidoreductase family protein, partial [Paracoccaceae bacterium]